MPREFELSKEVPLDATPEEVWEAIATGPGISSWFMGPHEVEPGVGGRITLTVGDVSLGSTITAWDPPKRLAFKGDADPDGNFHAMEYLVEARERGGTVLRFVHSGFAGDDWGDEFEDTTGLGWDMYLHTLAEYLTHFSGRPGTYVFAEGPPAPEGRDAWTVVAEGLGLGGPVTAGQRVRLTPVGLEPIEGVVDYTVPGVQAFLGVRGGDGLYRFHGAGDRVNVGHHLFAAGADPERASRAWRDWLARLFG